MRVAIIAAGEMGAAIGARLTQRGAVVTTSLLGRGAESRARAARAGMAAIDNDDALIATADLVLSILPPSEAVALARRLAPAVARRPPGSITYVDCNAVAPETVRQVAAIVTAAGAGFADGGIIGGPPREGYSPHLYVSGEGAEQVAGLREFGLDIRPIEGGVGAASALKLSYAALTKGLSAIAIAAARGAEHGGSAAALRAEFLESQPMLFAWLQRQVPTIYPKAYRWVGEMEEIARFLGDDATAGLFHSAAAVYRDVAAAWETRNEKELGFLADLFAR